jgi:putative SOS response-associated peptidase YedK
MWTRSSFHGPEDQDECDTYTMITTPANELVKPAHPGRMPVILRPGDYE